MIAGINGFTWERPSANDNGRFGHNRLWDVCKTAMQWNAQHWTTTLWLMHIIVRSFFLVSSPHWQLTNKLANTFIAIVNLVSNSKRKIDDQPNNRIINATNVSQIGVHRFLRWTCRPQNHRTYNFFFIFAAYTHSMWPCRNYEIGNVVCLLCAFCPHSIEIIE